MSFIRTVGKYLSSILILSHMLAFTIPLLIKHWMTQMGFPWIHVIVDVFLIVLVIILFSRRGKRSDGYTEKPQVRFTITRRVR